MSQKYLSATVIQRRDGDDEIGFNERTAKTLTASDRLPESYRINLWYNTNHEKENLC